MVLKEWARMPLGQKPWLLCAWPEGCKERRQVLCWGGSEGRSLAAGP